MSFTFDASYEEVDPDFRPTFESGLSHIRRDYALSEEVMGAVGSWLTVHSAETVDLLIHLLLSASPAKDWWVPLPAKTMRKYLPKAYKEKSALIKNGLIEVNDEYGRGTSKEYRVVSDLREEFYAVHRLQLLKRVTDLAETDKVPPRPNTVQRSRTYDANKHSLKQPLFGALRVLKEGRFDSRGILAHLQEQEIQLESAQSRAAEGGPDVEAHKAHAAWLEKRFQNDSRCLDSVLSQRRESLDDGWFTYRLAYAPTLTGRISQFRGGLQGATREMKRAAYERDPEIYNYDIVSSQAVILRAFLYDSGFNTEWLDEYMKGGKEKYAEKVGVDVDTWKICLYAVLYGASLVRPGNFGQSKGEIKSALLEYSAEVLSRTGSSQSVEDAARERYDSLRRVVGPFYRSAKQWRKWLASEWVAEQWVNSKAGKTIRNEAGVLLNKQLFDSWDTGERERSLAAFVVQGREAGFIHTLTAVLPSYGVIPISNEHDGLVVVGKIPHEAIEEACQGSKTTYLHIKPKPFV